jgi:hypothetical protein
VPDAEDAEEQGQPKAAPRIGYLVDGGGELGEMGGATGRSAAGETQGGRRRTWPPAEIGAGAVRLVLDDGRYHFGIFSLRTEFTRGFQQNAQSNAGGLQREVDKHRRMAIIRLVFTACTQTLLA